MTRTASAPGKLVLAGEYAVLEGAPAMVIAVNRRAVASLPAPGVLSAEARPLLESVCAVLGCPLPGNVALDTDSFRATAGPGSGVKLGLGSSAALTTALCRLLLPDETPAAQLLDRAIAAHRRFQGGAGSGVDIAASVTGGVIRFRMDDGVPDRLPWPGALHYSVWWSGVPSSTRQLLARLARSGPSSTRDDLARAARRVADCWCGDLHEELLPGMDAYITALGAFDLEHQLGVFAAGHGELTAAARSVGVLYKPCGAGGGDAGIALTDDEAALSAFAVLAVRQGFTRLDLSIDERGSVSEGSTP